MKKLVIFLMLISLFLINMEIAAAASLSALSAASYVNAFVYKSGNIQINWDNNVPDATGVLQYKEKPMTVTILPLRMSQETLTGIMT